MTAVFMSWEFGSGLGHMALLKPIAAGLAARGHRVVVALRNLAHAGRVFEGMPVEFLPTPTRTGRIAGSAEPIATHPQLLHVVGFGDAGELDTLVRSWQTLYDLVRPDVIVANFSPIAMLAARGGTTPVVAVGTGFECPGLSCPYPDWRPELKRDPATIQRDEQRVLENANIVLDRCKAPPLERLCDLYRETAATLLLTYPELDPFEGRPDGEYYGVWPDPPGIPPTWPETPGPRVFAYLRPLAGLRNVLALLIDAGAPAILRVPGAPDELRQEFQAPNLHWETGFLDLGATLRECDLGVCHASHTMSAAMLHAGKPILMFPPFLEQGLTAMRIANRRAGLFSSMDDPPHFTDAFHKLLTDRTYRDSAEEFARKYPSERRPQRLQDAVERIASLVA